MSEGPILKTIFDMERYYYGGVQVDAFSSDRFDPTYFMKTDAIHGIGTTGLWNRIYGANAWAQFNRDVNIFGALPKVAWIHSGFRALTNRSDFYNTIVGIDSGMTIPDAKTMSWEQVSLTPQIVSVVFEISAQLEYLARQGHDDAIAGLAHLRMQYAIEQAEVTNKILGMQASDWANISGNSVSSPISPYPLDLIVGDYTVEADNNHRYLYGFDRSTATWLNSNVIDKAGAELIDDDIIDLIKKVRKNGANPTLWVMGYEAYAKVQKMYSSEVRYNVLGEKKVKMSVNGIATPEGHDAGFSISTLYGIPVIVSKDVTGRSGGYLENIYLLDTSNPEGFEYPRLGVWVAKPVQYNEAGVSTGNPFAIGKYADKGMYWMMANNVSTFCKAQGKIIKAT